MVIVAHHEQSRASCVRIERVVAPSLDLGVVPPLLLGSHLVEPCDPVVSVCLLQVGWPESFSVIWILASIKQLFCAIIHDGDAFTCHGIGKRTLHQSNRGLQIQETRIVMVVNKVSKNRSIMECVSLLIESASDIIHRLSVTEDTL